MALPINVGVVLRATFSKTTHTRVTGRIFKKQVEEDVWDATAPCNIVFTVTDSGSGETQRHEVFRGIMRLSTRVPNDIAGRAFTCREYIVEADDKKVAAQSMLRVVSRLDEDGWEVGLLAEALYGVVRGIDTDSDFHAAAAFAERGIFIHSQWAYLVYSQEHRQVSTTTTSDWALEGVPEYRSPAGQCEINLLDYLLHKRSSTR